MPDSTTITGHWTRKEFSMLLPIQEDENIQNGKLMTKILPPPFYHFEWWFEILKIYHGSLSCAKVFSHLYSGREKKCCYLSSVTATNQIWQKNPTKRTFLSSFLSTLHPLNCFYALLHTELAMTSSAWHGKIFTRAALSHSSSCQWQLRDTHSLTLLSLR